MSDKQKKLYIVEWKTDSNYSPNVHIQENIRAFSLSEAKLAADQLFKALHEGKGEILEYRIWEISLWRNKYE